MLLIDLKDRIPARSSVDPDGITFVVLDPAGTRSQLGRVLATLVAMAIFFFAASAVFDANYFITTPMVTAYWAFIFVTLATYRVLTPIGAVLGIRITPHGVRLRSLLVRTIPRTDNASGVRGCGALPLGLGRPAPSLFLPFSEMVSVTRMGDTVLIRMHSGAEHQIPLYRTVRSDVTQIADELRAALARASAAGFTDRAEADAARAKLAALVPDTR